MYPLDFEEFCWANGVGASVFDMLRGCLKDEGELPGYLYDRLLDLFHQYVVVGGMPDAVNSFLATRNVDEVQETSTAIFTPCIAMTSQSTLRPSYAWLFAISMI